MADSAPDPGGLGEAGRRTTAGRSVTSKALAVLSVFDRRTPRATLTEIAASAGLPISTAHRLIAELVEWGGLVRQSDGQYEIGPRLWALGLLAPVSRKLREVALPFMQDLAATTGDNVHIAVRTGIHALYVERIAGTRSVAVVSRSGSELPLHATGVGKVLLAHASRETLAQAMNSLVRVTPYTVVDRPRMEHQLTEIRRRGWAETSEEMTIGTCSIAVPVFDSTGQVIAALGLVATSSRRGLAKLVPMLQLASRGITRSAGAQQD